MARQISSKSIKAVELIANKVNRLTENEIFENILRPKSAVSLKQTDKLLKSFTPVDSLSGRKRFGMNGPLDRLVNPRINSENIVLKTKEVVFPMKN